MSEGLTAPLPSRIVPPETMFFHVGRISRTTAPTLHFGNSALNRYDDPCRKFRTFYAAFDLPTALMESAFHQGQSELGARSISEVDIRDRLVRHVAVLQELNLADLCGPNVMASKLGLNLHQLTSRNYSDTQRVATQVHQHLTANGTPFDGLIYPSRNNFPGQCVCLFDQAQPKIVAALDTALIAHADWPPFVSEFGIVVYP